MGYNFYDFDQKYIGMTFEETIKNLIEYRATDDISIRDKIFYAYSKYV